MAGIKLGAGEIPPGREWAVGKDGLHFTYAGNLELWNRAVRRLLWQSRSKSPNIGKMAMQADGNLVIYDRYARALWSSGTWGNPRACPALREDGNVVIYSQDNRPRPLWRTANPRAVASRAWKPPVA